MNLKKSCFVQSFSFDMRFIYMMAADFLYYCGLYAILIFLVTGHLLPNIGLLRNLIANMNTISLDAFQSQFKSAQGAVILYSLLSLAAVVICYALFKSFIWMMLIKKKTGKKKAWELKTFFSRYSPRFAIVTLAMIVSFVLILYLGFAVMKEGFFPLFVVFIELPFFLHLSGILHYQLIASKRFWQATRQGLSIAIRRIHRFIIPYILMLLMILPLLLVVKAASYLPGPIFGFFLVLLMVSYLTWIKLYIARVIISVS